MSAPVDPLLRVRGLEIGYPGVGGATVPVVRGVNFEVGRGEVVGLVGETGSGKTLTGYALLRLLPHPVAITGGSIEFDGIDLALAGQRTMRGLRGSRIAMILQDPGTSLNPVFTIGAQLLAALRLHTRAPRRRVIADGLERLREVGLNDPERVWASYPHQLSGGMQQRVMIALALAGDPDLLVADEPTTALDVTIQAQILALLERLRAERGLSIILISHQLGVVAQSCSRIAIMYAGRIVEFSPTDDVVSRPWHPYTRSLFASTVAGARHRTPLTILPGTGPAPGQLPPGCPFAPRCAHATDVCRVVVPAPVAAGDRTAACILPAPTDAEVAHG